MNAFDLYHDVAGELGRRERTPMTNSSKIRVRPRGRMRKTVLVIQYQENASVSQAWMRGFVRYAKTAGWRVETLAYAGELREFREAREAVRYLAPDGVVSACCTREFAHHVLHDVPHVWFDAPIDTIPATARLSGTRIRRPSRWRRASYSG